MRSMIVVGVGATVLFGCFHRPSHALRIGDEVSPPQGLDSVSTAKWIAQQQAACPGKLHFLIDHMPTVSLDGSPVPYQSGIVAVVCARP
jgi:hypothetical protein